jgi:hypothetical protein
MRVVLCCVVLCCVVLCCVVLCCVVLCCVVLCCVVLCCVVSQYYSNRQAPTLHARSVYEGNPAFMRPKQYAGRFAF